MRGVYLKKKAHIYVCVRVCVRACVRACMGRWVYVCVCTEKA